MVLRGLLLSARGPGVVPGGIRGHTSTGAQTQAPAMQSLRLVPVLSPSQHWQSVSQGGGRDSHDAPHTTEFHPDIPAVKEPEHRYGIKSLNSHWLTIYHLTHKNILSQEMHN